ncbi:MAG: exopolyphosphatase, partial [Gammaproteobacteria bacterium]|nr:exopolyphosphatase [Gammaproteobacteria bacterium]
KLCVLLRLAVVLHRRRSDTELPDIDIKVKNTKVNLRFPNGWLGDHQLTTADLEQEASYLKAVGYKLKFK